MMMPTEWIVWDSDFASKPSSLIGGKARGLGDLVESHLPCPPAFCVTTSALQAATSDLVRGLPPGDGDLSIARDLGRLLVDLQLPHRLSQAILTASHSLISRLAAPSSRLAVRSSFASEDSVAASSAGVYRSETGVRAEDVPAAVKRVWASGFTAAAIEYRRSKGLPIVDLAMAVVVQEMLVASAGGVAYTVVPGTMDPTAVVIEYAAGSPANVINNVVAPTRFAIIKREVWAPSTASGDPCGEAGELSKARLCELATALVGLERTLNAPLDVEWLVDNRDKLWLLQARKLYYAPPSDCFRGFTAEARGTSLRSEKLVPFRLQRLIDLHTIAAHLILPSAFDAFKTAGGAIPEALGTECGLLFDDYSRNGRVSVRSAYWSALNPGDMLPQSPMLSTSADCLAYLASYWTYIIDHNLADYSAEVALLVSNWTDLRASAVATCVDLDGIARVIISALYGQLEGLETCAHDVYEVDATTLKIAQSSIPTKQFAVLTPRRPPESVPETLTRLAVLTAAEVVAVASTTAKVGAELGPVRIEFLILRNGSSAEERVLTWQVTQIGNPSVILRYYTLRRGDGSAGALGRGRLVRLRDPQNACRLSAGVGDQIILVNLDRFELRDPNVATALAQSLGQVGLPIVLNGSLLSHFASLLRDHGLEVYPTNDPLEMFADGELVEIVIH